MIKSDFLLTTKCLGTDVSNSIVLRRSLSFYSSISCIFFSKTLTIITGHGLVYGHFILIECKPGFRRSWNYRSAVGYYSVTVISNKEWHLYAATRTCGAPGQLYLLYLFSFLVLKQWICRWDSIGDSSNKQMISAPQELYNLPAHNLISIATLDPWHNSILCP